MSKIRIINIDITNGCKMHTIHQIYYKIGLVLPILILSMDEKCTKFARYEICQSQVILILIYLLDMHAQIYEK